MIVVFPGLDVSGFAITSVDGVPVTNATDGPVASTGAAPIQAPRIVTVPQPAMPDWAYPFTPVTDLPSVLVQARINSHHCDLLNDTLHRYKGKVLRARPAAGVLDSSIT